MQKIFKSYFSKSKNSLCLCIFVVLICNFLLACGGENTPRPAFVPPTPPPTPSDFSGVAPAATVALPFQPTSTVNTDPQASTPAPNAGNDDYGRGFSGENPDPTTLAQLFGTPGPNAGQNIPPSNSRTNPTPTLNLAPGQTNVASLRSSKVSFLFSYRQSLLRMQATQPNARLVFASANALTPTRTIWNFFFVWLNGPKMWRIVFDADGDKAPNLAMTEQPPAMLADYNAIDMTRVLDGDELVSRAEAAGVRTNLPVQIINFGVDGVSRQPAFVLTNITQGKQLVLHAYTGQVIRNEFG